MIALALEPGPELSSEQGIELLVNSCPILPCQPASLPRPLTAIRAVIVCNGLELMIVLDISSLCQLGPFDPSTLRG